jgi:hypothetical protein
MGRIERSLETPVIHVGSRIPQGYGLRGVTWREREVHYGCERTDSQGFFYFRRDDDPSTTSFVHRDELMAVSAE